MIMFRRLTLTCWNSSRLSARFCQASSTARTAEEDTITRLITSPTFLADCTVTGFSEFEKHVRGLPVSGSRPFGNAVPSNLIKIYTQLIKTRLSILPNLHKFVTLALNVRGSQTPELAADMLKSLLSNQDGWSIDSANNYLSILYQLLNFGVSGSKEMNSSLFDENLTRTISADRGIMSRLDSIKLALKINQVNELLSENGFKELTSSFREITTLVPSNFIPKLMTERLSVSFEELVELLELAHYGLNDVSNTLTLLEAIEARIEESPEVVSVLEVDHVVKVACG